MITRKFTINVNNNSASSNPKIVLYKGDLGLLLNLTLSGFNFNVDVKSKVHASVYNGANLLTTLKNIPLNENTIILSVNNGGISTLITGIYHIQLHLFDENNNRISVPPFDIEIRDTIY